MSHCKNINSLPAVSLTLQNSDDDSILIHKLYDAGFWKQFAYHHCNCKNACANSISFIVSSSPLTTLRLENSDADRILLNFGNSL